MDPLAAYAFRVLVGTQEFGFSKVSGLAREAETVTYQEGGLNDRVHVLPGAVKSGGVLRLERGAYAGEQLPFYLVGEYLPGALRLEIRNPINRAVSDKVYVLTGLVVKKWEVGDLDAMQNTLLIDHFEIAYEYAAVSS